MMSIKKLAAGSAADYLVRQAAQDAALPAGGLTSYYTEQGEAFELTRGRSGLSVQ